MDLQVQQQSPLFFINSIDAKNIPSNNSTPALSPAKCELLNHHDKNSHAHLAFKFQFPEFLHLVICGAVRVIICHHAYQIMTSSAYKSIGYRSFFIAHQNVQDLPRLEIGIHTNLKGTANICISSIDINVNIK